MLLRCCVAADPVEALARARRESPTLAPLLETIDEDGLRWTALLCRKLRFERIVRGDPELASRFASDPATFTDQFAGYLRAEPYGAVFPTDEADRFRRYLARTSPDRTDPDR